MARESVKFSFVIYAALEMKWHFSRMSKVISEWKLLSLQMRK